MMDSYKYLGWLRINTQQTKQKEKLQEKVWKETFFISDTVFAKKKKNISV